jgi:hypothetical protein
MSSFELMTISSPPSPSSEKLLDDEASFPNGTTPSRAAQIIDDAVSTMWTVKTSVTMDIGTQSRGARFRGRSDNDARELSVVDLQCFDLVLTGHTTIK